MDEVDKMRSSQLRNPASSKFKSVLNVRKKTVAEAERYERL